MTRQKDSSENFAPPYDVLKYPDAGNDRRRDGGLAGGDGASDTVTARNEDKVDGSSCESTMTARLLLLTV
jgi:hypothetical protein